MQIRLETKRDYREVENLTREAFWNVYRPGCVEHYVLHKLRNNQCFIPELDYVMEADGKIIANIVYAKAKVDEYPVIIFGPVSVLPEHQGKGCGKKIISYTLDKARELGYPLVLITGNPDYYKKYGFESASKYGIFYEGMDKNEEFPFFMVKILDIEKAKPIRGTYADPDVYKVDKKEVEEFDKDFPPKVKEVREGQLE